VADQHRVWTAIADSFARTRQRPWPHVEEFLRSLPAGARVLDLMAGNGRHGRLAAALGLDVVSLDWSQPLVRQAPGAVAGDAVALPFADASFEAAVYAAGLHGLPTPQQRMASLRELHRVLRPGGRAQVTVWSREAPRFVALGLPPGPADVTVPWRADGHDAPRFYHLHTAQSLHDALAEAGFKVDAVDAVPLAADAPDNLVATVRRR
jgi:tRNA (uracil-5-)-methyltransferase TRM9